MVSRAAPALTRIGFRRDVRLFLLVLGGLFAVLIIALLLAVESAYNDAHQTRVQQWNRVADQAAEDVTQAKERGLPVDSVVTAIQARYGIESLRLAPEPPPVTGSEATLTRRTPAGVLVLTFDDSPLVVLRRKMLATTAISLAGAAGGIILLLLYIPKIIRPLEEMLDQARTMEARDPDVAEDEYLIETFRKSIETLKLQREELQRLHDEQKTRADEFERVTAALTRSLTSGLMAIDAAGVVREINQAGRDILRVAQDEPLAGRGPAEAIGATELAAILQQSFDARTALVRRQVETRTAGGDEIIVGVTTVPLLGDDNSFLGMLALFTDLTDIRRLETRVRDLQSLADVGELSAGIAHEFRNSLSTILGYLRLAQRQSSPDDVRAKIHSAETEAVALGAAVDSLLNFARPMKPDLQNVDLHELVSEVVTRLEPHANGFDIDVRGNGRLEADPALLSRAVENVIRNAIDAIHAGGRAGKIGIALANDPPSIAITDNGIGIDSEAASRLFLPFQSRKPHGLGLGLPLARKIVLLSGGDIRVNGVPGEGTTVTMEFSESAPATA